MDQLGEWEGARDTLIWPAVAVAALVLAIVAASAGILLLAQHFTWAT